MGTSESKSDLDFDVVPTNGSGLRIDGEQHARYVPFFAKCHVKQPLAPWAKPYASLGHLSMSLSITSTDHRLAMASDRMNRVPRLPGYSFAIRCNA
jgi:hypothetical protein